MLYTQCTSHCFIKNTIRTKKFTNQHYCTGVFVNRMLITNFSQLITSHEHLFWNF